MEAAGLDTSEAAVKIRSWQAAQDDFLRKTGFVRQYSRESTAHFGYTQSSKVVKQAEEFYQEWSKSIGSNDAIKCRFVNDVLHIIERKKKVLG